VPKSPPNVIPKEKLSAYERWELASFDVEEPAIPVPVASAPDPVPEPVPVVEIPPPPPLVSEEEIEALKEQARQDGHQAGLAAGHEEGRTAGYAEGHEAGLAEARQNAEQSLALLDALKSSLDEMDQNVADALLALALEVAEQLVRHTLKVRPEILLSVVREAINSLPQHQGPPTVLAHPDDVTLLRALLGDQITHSSWRLVEDEGIARGGCRVEIGPSMVDASLPTRWRRILDSIGTSGEWLEE